MIRLSIGVATRGGAAARTRRERFGLDAPLPADPHIVQRAVLRHLADTHPDLFVFVLDRPHDANASPVKGPQIDLAHGVPDLLLVRPGGGLVFLAVRAQAHRSSRPERAFADLCRTSAVPFHIVRSLPEARRVLDRLDRPNPLEAPHGSKEGSIARRTP